MIYSFIRSYLFIKHVDRLQNITSLTTVVRLRLSYIKSWDDITVNKITDKKDGDDD